MALGFAYGILSLSRGNIHDELCKLIGIAGTLHKLSMPQVSGYFETETLPPSASI